MTVPANDDPEIVVLGDESNPAPSAPPAAISSTLPTVIATPVTSTSTPDATAPPLAAATTSNAGGNIERTTNADGSLTVKITTTRTQPTGHREVTTEHFHIPSGVVSTVALSLDQGDPPSGLYMTRMEQQTLPPGTGEVTTRPPAYPTPGFENTQQPQPAQPNTPASQESNDDVAAMRNRGVGILFGVVAVVIMALEPSQPELYAVAVTLFSVVAVAHVSVEQSLASRLARFSDGESASHERDAVAGAHVAILAVAALASMEQRPVSHSPYVPDDESGADDNELVDEAGGRVARVFAAADDAAGGGRKRKEERKKEKGVTSAPASPPEAGGAPSNYVSEAKEEIFRERHDRIDAEAKK